MYGLLPWTQRIGLYYLHSPGSLSGQPSKILLPKGLMWVGARLDTTDDCYQSKLGTSLLPRSGMGGAVAEAPQYHR